MAQLINMRQRIKAIETIKKQSSVKKYHTDTCNEELDALMESTIVDKPKESMKHFDENNRHESQDKLTKWERKLLKLVKKL